LPMYPPAIFLSSTRALVAHSGTGPATHTGLEQRTGWLPLPW
jgi:hypothetical protein